MELEFDRGKKPEISFIFNEKEREEMLFIMKNLLQDANKLNPNELTRAQVGALVQLRCNILRWQKDGLMGDLENSIDLALKCGYLLKNYDRKEDDGV